MATFKRSVITEKGKEYISRALSNNTKILLNRIESTEYIYNDTVDITKVLSLDNPKQSVNISEITKNKEKVKIRGVFTNDGLSVTYKMNAIGVYAKDDASNEILFAVLVADNPDTISPPQGQTVTTITLDLVFVLSDEVNVSLTVDNNALVSIHTHNEFKEIVEKNYVRNIDYSTEEKHGIAKIYSETEAEATSNKVKEIVEAGNGDTQEMINETPTGETFWSKFIKTLDHTKILTVKGLVKILQKIIKPAGETSYGMVNYQTIRTVSPKPDLSPYIPFSKGYRNGNSTDSVVRTNNHTTWTGYVLEMWNGDTGIHMGSFHTNGGRAYYKVPNRNGNNWNEIMDNKDMEVRDTRMNNMDADRNNIRNLAQDAWNRTENLYWVVNNDTVREIRLVGYILERGAFERDGYVLTVTNAVGSGTVQFGRRALQQRRGVNGQNWYNVPFG